MDPYEAIAVDPIEGDEAPEWRVGPLTRTHIVKYAGASGDFTPMHHDEMVARNAGFSEVFAMGMLPAGVLAHYVSDWLSHSRIREYGVRFTDQVWPGQTLVCHGVVTRRYEYENETLVDCDLEMKDADAEMKVLGTTTACLDDPVKLPE